MAATIDCLAATAAERFVPDQQQRQPRRVGAAPFQRFGAWSRRVQVARDRSIHRLARWMALQPDARRQLNQGNAASRALWEACREANPTCFKEYRIARLDRPSYFLPAGEVVFSVMENPVQVPDNPPRGVMMRHMEAMNAFPLAKFYFLRPVFAEPRGGANYRLLPPSELREEAEGDFRVAAQIARRFGWVHHSERWMARQADRAGRLALSAAGSLVDGLLALLPSADDEHGWLNPAAAGTASQSLALLTATAEARGRLDEAARFRSSIAELRRRMDIDPVLCFELPERPGELWFESHWFEGADGRTYVHY